MDIKIGIRNVSRELSVETSASSDEIEKQLRDALTGDNGVFSVTDNKGRRVLVPASAIGYVDLGQEHARPVGFGAL